MNKNIAISSMVLGSISTVYALFVSFKNESFSNEIFFLSVALVILAIIIVCYVKNRKQKYKDFKFYTEGDSNLAKYIITSLKNKDSLDINKIVESNDAKSGFIEEKLKAGKLIIQIGFVITDKNDRIIILARNHKNEWRPDELSVIFSCSPSPLRFNQAFSQENIFDDLIKKQCSHTAKRKIEYLTSSLAYNDGRKIKYYFHIYKVKFENLDFSKGVRELFNKKIGYYLDRKKDKIVLAKTIDEIDRKVVLNMGNADSATLEALYVNDKGAGLATLD